MSWTCIWCNYEKNRDEEDTCSSCKSRRDDPGPIEEPEEVLDTEILSEPITSDLDEYYRVLELETGASLEAVKQAYRDLTKVWDPSRFRYDVNLEKRAKERAGAIDEAYGHILLNARKDNHHTGKLHQLSGDAHGNAKYTLPYQKSDGALTARQYRSAERSTIQPPLNAGGSAQFMDVSSTKDVLASQAQRFWTWILDFVALYFFALLFGFIMGLLGFQRLMHDMNKFALGIVIYIGYYLSQEPFGGRTLGKLIAGTKAVNEDSADMTFGQVIGRTLARFIPFEAFSFLGQNGRPRGWHDRVSGTKVITVR